MWASKIGEPVLHGRILLVPTLFASVDGAKFRQDFLKRLSDFLKLFFVHADLSTARNRALEQDRTSAQPIQRSPSFEATRAPPSARFLLFTRIMAARASGISEAGIIRAVKETE